MARFHVATSEPTKQELIERWAPSQPWGPDPGNSLSSLGSFHFDDPEGQVGMETHLIDAGGLLLQIPLTYRGEPLDDRAATLVGTLEHSVLGTRWVYDGLTDSHFLTVLAGVALTGQGQALGMAHVEQRWFAAPAEVTISGGGWGREPVPIDRLERTAGDDLTPTFSNDRFAMVVHRRPLPAPAPPIGLVARTEAMVDPVVVVTVDRI